MKHQNLFVFDIETVPDLEAAKNLVGEGADLRQALVDYHLKVTNGQNDFLRQPFHKVVAISFLVAEIHYDGDEEFYILKDIRSGGKEKATEKELIQGFFQYLSNMRARIVSFNGRTFDMPVLKYRAMRHGISARWLFKTGDKWNGYNNRYSSDWHCDLLEVLSDFGASSRVKMNEVCAMLGLPGKIGIDGSQVETMFNDGKLKEIRDYCEIDVINTYLIYLRYSQLTGTLNNDNYTKCIGDLLAYLEQNLDNNDSYEKFIMEWSSKV